jgi:lysophospholipase L1-like esterase
MIPLLMGAIAAYAQPPLSHPSTPLPPIARPVSETPPACAGALCGTGALTPFFRRLASAGNRPIHIIQIGDSHTAADAITNGLRSELQRRFGKGGRGVMAPGRPYPRVATWNVTGAHGEGWTTTGLLDSAAPGAPLGPTGFTQSTNAAGRKLTITADDEEQLFTGFRVCALTRPGAGAVRLSVGGAALDWSLDGPAGAQCRTVESPQPAARAELVTLTDRPVSITSVATFRRGGGVLLSNFGVIGAQIAHLERIDDRIAAAELAAAAPDLLIVAYGTNEAFRQDLGEQEYEQGLRDQVARLRRLVGPNVPILLIGPPDVARRRAADPVLACGESYSTPALLPAVREAQRRLARELGLAFWDWELAMGGRCSSRRWHAEGLMRDDHIHFNRDGGDRIGRMLFTDLASAGIVYDPRWGGTTGTLPPRAGGTNR